MRSPVRRFLTHTGVFAALLLVAATGGAQQPTDPPLPPGHPPIAPPAAEPLPPGHPPIAPTAAAPAGDLPPGHPPVGAPPPVDPAAPLPPGHPPIDAASAPPPQTAPGPGGNNPHGATTADRNDPDTTLPPGTIVATIVNQAGQPLAGREVRLGVLRQSITEGEARSFQNATTNAAGEVRFSSLNTETAFSYRVTVSQDGAEYASTPFNLRPEHGQRVLLHIYPVTRDLAGTMVGMRGIVVVEPRDDIFQMEIMLRIFNVGRTTWVPDNVTFQLPEGAKGFVANDNEAMTDTRVKLEGDRTLQLLGTYTPGQHDLTFRVQVPNKHDSSRDIEMSLPPRVAELRVIVAASPGMSMTVAGFEAAEPSLGNSGERMLVTSKQLRPGEPEMELLTISLSGIPTPGPGRWIALGLALAAALAGLLGALGRTREQTAALPAQDVSTARRRLLDELVDLERAFQAKEIGPKTYATARKTLVDALTRIEAENPIKTKGSVRVARA